MSEIRTNRRELTSERMIRNGTWGASLLAGAGLILTFVGFAIAEINSWKDYFLLGAPALLFLMAFIGLIFIRRGRLVLGTALAFIANLIVPLVETTFQQDVGWALFLYTIVSSGLLILRTLPRQSRRWATALTILTLVMVASLEIGDSAIRVDPAEELLTVIIATTAILSIAFAIQFSIELWNSGRLRSKIVLLLILMLTPIFLIANSFIIITQEIAFEEVLLERAEASAVTGAVTIGHLFESAIDSGDLTYEQVFDQNYVKFWEFDPANDPNYDPETDAAPDAFDKYHTAYDMFTDSQFRTILDTNLTQPDIIYSVAQDINGYVPTHNTPYATGDGSAASDRTKRIFDDAVGLAASRNTEPFLQQIYEQSGTGATLWDVSAPIYVKGEHWGTFRVGLELAENQERVSAANWRVIGAFTLSIVALLAFAWIFSRFISAPVERLTDVAVEAAGGNLNQTIEIVNRDEITVLADAFNTMISQLRELIGGLEQRISERTRALETSTQVSRQLSTILDQRQLVREVVDQVQSAFDYYHVHIYLFDEKRDNLVMMGGTGEAGRTMLSQGHAVAKGRGLVGRAADTNLPILVQDVSQADNWLPNPLLPETKAEAAIPIAVGNNVLGVLDVQDNELLGLTDSDVDLLQAIANQVAIAIQNARAYQETQQQVAREALISHINQQILSTNDVEEALKIAVRELGRALGTSTSVKLRQSDDSSDNGNAEGSYKGSL